MCSVPDGIVGLAAPRGRPDDCGARAVTIQMIEASVAGADLEVAVSGHDAWLLSLRRRWHLTVPVATVRRVAVAGGFGPFTRRHLVYRRSERLHTRGRLICARFAAPTLRIDLDGGPYGLIILSVPDPEAAAAAIAAAIKQPQREAALKLRADRK
jgi:hypothetical protein